MKLLLKVVLLTSSLLLTSCAGFTNVNQRFEEQYGMEIEKIRMSREMAKVSASQAEIGVQNNPVPPANSDWRDDLSSAKVNNVIPQHKFQDDAYYAYEDRRALDTKRYGEMYMPNQDYRGASGNRKSLPDDMFEITYNTTPHPPFVNIGGDFDAIIIPTTDAYQVKTEPSNKPYLLVDATSLQNSVDKINAQRTVNDIADSEELIIEKKRLRREATMLTDAKENNAKKNIAKKSDKEKQQIVVYNASVETKKKSSIFDGLQSKRSVKN